MIIELAMSILLLVELQAQWSLGVIPLLYCTWKLKQEKWV